jgi:hypothetical protein
MQRMQGLSVQRPGIIEQSPLHKGECKECNFISILPGTSEEWQCYIAITGSIYYYRYISWLQLYSLLQERQNALA